MPSRARPALLPSSAPPPPSSAKYQRHRRTSTTTHHAAATLRASALPCSSCAAALVRPVAAPRQRQGPALRRPRPVPVPRPAPLRPCPPRCHLQQRKAAHTPKPASTTTPPPRHHTPPHASARPSRASVNPAPLRHRTPRRHLQQGKRPALRRCGLARPIINLQQGKARSTERQPGGERARKQGLRWCKIINVVPAAKLDEASTAARSPRSQVFPGGRGRYEQTGRLLRGTWTCGRGPAARGSGMVSLGSKLG